MQNQDPSSSSTLPEQSVPLSSCRPLDSRPSPAGPCQSSLAGSVAFLSHPVPAAEPGPGCLTPPPAPDWASSSGQPEAPQGCLCLRPHQRWLLQVGTDLPGAQWAGQGPACSPPEATAVSRTLAQILSGFPRNQPNQIQKIIPPRKRQHALHVAGSHSPSPTCQGFLVTTRAHTCSRGAALATFPSRLVSGFPR